MSLESLRLLAQDLVDHLHSLLLELCAAQMGGIAPGRELTTVLYLEVHWLLRDLSLTLGTFIYEPRLVVCWVGGMVAIHPALIEAAGTFVYRAHMRLVALAFLARIGHAGTMHGHSSAALIRILHAIQVRADANAPGTTLLGLANLAAQCALDAFVFVTEPPSMAELTGVTLPSLRFGGFAP